MKLGIVVAVFGLAMLFLAGELGVNSPKTAWAQEAPSCLEPLPGLVSWWPGDVDADDLQSSNRGRLRNGAAIKPAYVDDGFILDGIDDKIVIPDSANQSLDGLTFSAWVYWDGFTESDLTAVIASKPGAYELGIHNFGGPEIYLELTQVGGTKTILTTEYNHMPRERWAYVTVTYDNVYGGLNIYIDGDPYASTVLLDRGAIAPSESDLTLGATEDGSHFKGMIDEVELYNRGLSRAEIEDIITRSKSGKCSGGLEIIVSVSPPWAPQMFDIIVNGEMKVDDLSGTDTTGELRVLTGFQTIDITDSEGYPAVGVTTTYECRDAGDLVIRWGDGGALTELPINDGDFVTCTMNILVEDPGPPPPPPPLVVATEAETPEVEPVTAEPPPPNFE
jgi:hypothetical protein